MHVEGLRVFAHSVDEPRGGGQGDDQGDLRDAQGVAKTENEVLNWSNVRCTLKEYAMLEAPWERRAGRLAVCIAADDASNLAGVCHQFHSAAIWCGMCHIECVREVFQAEELFFSPSNPSASISIDFDAYSVLLLF